MMREVWPKLGHQAPDYLNDRAGKSFELFLPGLAQEFSQTSALIETKLKVTTSRNNTRPQKAQKAQEAQVEAQEAQVEAQEAQEAQVKLSPWQTKVLAACRVEPQTTRSLLSVAGYKSRAGNFKKGLRILLEQRLLEPTIPDRPNSRLQKYRLTDRGRHILAQTSPGEF
jgi:ATP-dependent DNA helicase RecG